MSPEEFFMYLIIALVVTIPISARVYRYLTRNLVKRMLHEQFGRQEERKTPAPTDRR